MQGVGQLIYHISDQLPHLGVSYDGQPTLINNRLEKATGRTVYCSQARNAHEWAIKG